MPPIAGAYQLRLVLDGPTRITIGRLGTFDFLAGVYVYTGSALGGLEQRLARHRRTEKRLRWHIDYLLQHARIVGEEMWRTTERIECEVNRLALEHRGARVLVPRFGASDCRCPSHLVYLGRAADM